MTLIATAISRLGVVQASDSNVTSDRGLEREAQKVFRVDGVGGVLALAGTYSVGGRLMDEWMPAVIGAYAGTAAPTLHGFAEFLRVRLAAEITPRERKSGSLVHIVGYVEVDGEFHPEFWFIRNVYIDQTTGDYVVQDRFDLTEDFWFRDYLNPGVQEALEAGKEMRYFNGLVPGRVAYLEFMQSLSGFLEQAWSKPGWKFRAPRTIDDLARFISLEVRTVGAMFSSSDYPAPYIGGEVQVATIAAPTNAAILGRGPTNRRGDSGDR